MFNSLKHFISFIQQSPSYATMFSVTPNDITLPDLLKTKSREAFIKLYDKYSGAIYGIIYKMIQKQNIAEELLQDVFVKVWRNIDRYDSSKGTLFAWMLQITRNTCIDHLRTKEHKIKFHNEVNLQETLATPEIYCNNENSELRGLALKLEVKYRQIIDLVYFWGYSQEEVSKMLHIPLGTVKTRSRAGLQQLRSLYQNMNRVLNNKNEFKRVYIIRNY